MLQLPVPFFMNVWNHRLFDLRYAFLLVEKLTLKKNNSIYPFVIFLNS